MLSQSTKQIIKDIVSHYPEGDRVKVVRSIFKSEATYEHFIYLGVQIEREKIRTNFNRIDEVFRLKTLSYLN